MTIKNKTILAVFIAASLGLAGGAQAQQTPQAKILVVDINAALAASKVGKDMQRQLLALQKQVEGTVQGRVNGLQEDKKKLDQQKAILSASVKSQREKELQSKYSGLQQYANDQRLLLEGAQYKARQTIEGAVKGILQAVMKARGATMIMDKNMILMGSDNSLEITGEVTKRLDQQIPTIKVALTQLPPDLLAAAKRQMAQQAAAAQGR